MSLEESTSQLKQTFTKIDYAALYEKIGDIVIERAHVGNKECQNIYSTAWQKTKESQS
jgi:hypothetical protein